MSFPAKARVYIFFKQVKFSDDIPWMGESFLGHNNDPECHQLSQGSKESHRYSHSMTYWQISTLDIFISSISIQRMHLAQILQFGRVATI